MIGIFMEFFYGWINENIISYIGLLLSVASIVIAGLGFINFRTEKRRLISKILIIFGCVLLIYSIGIFFYEPGFVTGRLKNDTIVESTEDYKHAQLCLDLYENEFNVYDETSTQTLHFGKEILNIEKSNVVHISLEHSETGNVYREFKIKNGAIVFPELPNGNYFFEIQIKGYSRYSKTLKLNSNYISASYKNRPNSWSVDVHLSKNKDLEFYPFNVRLVDTNGNPLSDFKYSMGKIEPFYGGLKTDESGYLKYQFEGKENSSFYISYEDDLGNSYQKEITFENVNKNLIVTIDYTNKIMPTNKEINTPNLLDVYYVDFGYGLERKITAESGVFTSVSSAEGTELYDVLVKTDIDLSDKNVVISIPSGAGGTCNNIMGRDLSFKASKGVYTISIYYPDGTLLNFVDIDIAKSDTFNLNFSQ